ncbi:cytochrome P450 [Aspergillus crustosus]
MAQSAELPFTVIGLVHTYLLTQAGQGPRTKYGKKPGRMVATAQLTIPHKEQARHLACKRERHLYPQRHLQATITLYLLCALALKVLNAHLTPRNALSQSATLTAIYLAGIFASLTVHRLFLNPLNKFPSLPFAKLTTIAQTIRISKNMDRHMILYKAHKKWGRFVRYGPNDISVSDADVVRVALGPEAVCTKAPWYASEYPNCSLISGLHSTSQSYSNAGASTSWATSPSANPSTIQSAPLLNACIFETLRLHPAVPSGLPRKTPPEGVYVGGRYIPGDTVMVNFYAMGRGERHFLLPDSFIPERFTTRPDLILHKDALIPFSTGPASCVGKNLAMMEVRLLTTRLVMGYDVGFAEGEDGEGLVG